jgi:hypothetical protein
MFRKAKTLSQIGIIAIILLGGMVCAGAMGLAVSPGRIDLQGVPLGSKVTATELAREPLYLKISNNSSTAFDYVINILHTSETPVSLPSGYQDIPDTGWITFEMEEIHVEAGKAKEVELYFNLPDSPAYAGKKYQAIIEVKSKKNKPEEVFVLAAQVRVCFTTQAADEGE